MAKTEAKRTDGTPEPRFEAGATGLIYVASNNKRKAVTNFLAWITKQQVHDDGAAQIRFYEIVAGFPAGESEDNLVRTDGDRNVIVPAADFEDLGWVADQLGCDFRILQPGRRGRDLASKAIQWFTTLQGGAPEAVLYQHTGWREVDKIWCYLHGRGALGKEKVQTDLRAENLHRYELPTTAPSRAELRAAVKSSLALLELGPEQIMYPLLSAVYRAPLAHFVPCTVLPHLVGATGAFKSTLAALMLSHYGAFAGKEELPANWRFTQASLEKLLFLAKDVLIVVDDLYPEETAAERFKMEATFSKVVGAVGDARGKLRASANMALRAEYFPRGVVLSTGEYTPTFSQSRHARMLVISIKKGDITAARLTEAQRNAPALNVAMAGYVTSLQQKFCDLGPRLTADFQSLRAGLSSGHARIVENAAHLLLGLQEFLRFATECGALSQREAVAHFQRGTDALKELANQQAQEIQEADPTVEFIQILKEALGSHTAYLASRNDGSFEQGGNETQLLGYLDDKAVYLLPETTFRFVNKFRREKGHGPVNEKHLKRSLAEKGLLFNCEEGRSDRTTKCAGRAMRVMWIVRNAILDDPPAEAQSIGKEDFLDIDDLSEAIQ